MKKFILIFSLIFLISLLHYLSPTSMHHLHAIYQRLYYVPIILSAYWLGAKIGLITAIATGILYAPHIFLHWSYNPMESFTQYVEIGMFLIIGTLVGFLSDIQKKQHNQIHKANLKIHRMDRLSLLGQLAAGLAHEIRNPLGSLIGSTDIIKDEIGKENNKYEFVDIMDKELHRLKDKLDEFLKFARTNPPQKIPNNLNDVINGAIILVEKSASKSNVKIEQNLATDMPLREIDGEQIKQIIVNLVLNSVQAMAEGGKIVIESKFDDRAISFTVKDNGPGFSDEEKEEIFKPFYTTKEEGTGLGLAIVKELIISMGGTISAESKGDGAIFNVRIPNE